MASRLFFNPNVIKAGARSSFRTYSSSSAKSNYFEELKHSREHAKKATDLWRKISLYFALPIVVVTSVNAYILASEHEKHLEEHPLVFKAWPHLHIRNKSFPWGDGEKPLFYNPKVNKLPGDE